MRVSAFALAGVFLLLSPDLVAAQEEAAISGGDTAWLLTSTALVLLMTAGLVWSTVVIKPPMADLRERIGSFDAPQTTSQRAAFAELHEQSKQTMSIALLGAVLLLCSY